MEVLDDVVPGCSARLMRSSKSMSRSPRNGVAETTTGAALELRRTVSFGGFAGGAALPRAFR